MLNWLRSIFWFYCNIYDNFVILTNKFSLLEKKLWHIKLSNNRVLYIHNTNRIFSGRQFSISIHSNRSTILKIKWLNSQISIGQKLLWHIRNFVATNKETLKSLYSRKSTFKVVWVVCSLLKSSCSNIISLWINLLITKIKLLKLLNYLKLN